MDGINDVDEDEQLGVADEVEADVSVEDSTVAAVEIVEVVGESSLRTIFRLDFLVGRLLELALSSTVLSLLLFDALGMFLT